LILPLPNAPFILTTLERVLRYAEEFNFPPPSAQIELIQHYFTAASSAEQAVLIANHATASHGGRIGLMVDDLLRTWRSTHVPSETTTESQLSGSGARATP
jgi:hypothetical protein